jgi:hypothetical protein
VTTRGCPVRFLRKSLFAEGFHSAAARTR